MILFLLHTTLLSIFSYLIVKMLNRIKLNFENLIFTYLLFWSNILFTSFILSFFHVLNLRFAYFTLSILVQSLIFGFIYKGQKQISFRLDFLSFPKLRFDLMTFSIIFITLVFISQFILAYCFIPLTPDTLFMKLTKIYAYLDHGRLLPNPDFDGGLLFISPLNSAVTWMYFIIHRVSFNALHFFSLFNWIIIALSSYSLCRKLSISKTGSFLASIFLICSDAFLLNSTGDNDDIIAASSFSIAVLAFVHWYFDKRIFYIVLAGLALGISIGIKPFAALYYQLVLGIILYHIKKYGFMNSLLFIKKYFLQGCVFSLAILIMLSGFFYENYKVRGNPFQLSSLLNSIRNSPFSFKAAGINLATQNMELFLAPIIVPTGIGNRDILAERANNIAKNVINKTFETDQDEVNRKYSGHFNKTMIAQSLFYDHSVSFGFYPHLLLFSALMGLVFLDKVNLFIYILGLSFLFPDIGYSIHNKYVAGIMRYWMLMFVITAPLIGFIFDKAKSNQTGFLRRVYIPVFLIHFVYLIFTSFYGLFNNYYRSIGAIITKNYTPFYEAQISKRIVETLPRLKEFNIVYVHNYPNALIHRLAPDSRVISKFIIQASMPNIVLSIPVKLGIQDYSSSTRILNIPIDELKENFYVYLGDIFGSRVFINRLPKTLINIMDKKEILFYFIQPIDINSNESRVRSGLASRFDEEDLFECSYYRIDSQEKKIQVTPWINFTETSFVFSKNDKSIQIMVRNKKTKKIYYSDYPV